MKTHKSMSAGGKRVASRRHKSNRRNSVKVHHKLNAQELRNYHNFKRGLSNPCTAIKRVLGITE